MKIIIGCIWSNLGDVIFGRIINQELIKANVPAHDVIFYFKDEEIMAHADMYREFINKVIPQAKLLMTANDVINYLRGFNTPETIIINTTPKYNQLYYGLLRMRFVGSYYRIFDYSQAPGYSYANEEQPDQCDSKQMYDLNPEDYQHNIYTGFGGGTNGILVFEKPKKSLPIFDTKYHVFTCYGHEAAYIQKFIDFLNKEIDDRHNKPYVLVVQGKFDIKDFPEYKKVVDQIPYISDEKFPVYQCPGQPIKLMVPGIYISLEQSLELICYSDPITMVTGNLSMSACISFDKIMFLEWWDGLTKTQCMFWDFIKEHKYDDLLPLFKQVINMIRGKKTLSLKQIQKLKPRLIKFYNMLRKDYDLGKNMLKRIDTPAHITPKAITKNKNIQGGGEIYIICWQLCLFVGILILCMIIIIHYFKEYSTMLCNHDRKKVSID